MPVYLGLRRRRIAERSLASSIVINHPDSSIASPTTGIPLSLVLFRSYREPTTVAYIRFYVYFEVMLVAFCCVKVCTWLRHAQRPVSMLRADVTASTGQD